MKKTICDILKVALSLLLGGAILYWMYRDFDFRHMEHVLLHEMNWTWMLLSFPFGILAQAFRGWRWCQALEPVDERPRAAVAVNSIFLSYAVSLVVPASASLRVAVCSGAGTAYRFPRRWARWSPSALSTRYSSSW